MKCLYTQHNFICVNSPVALKSSQLVSSAWSNAPYSALPAILTTHDVVVLLSYGHIIPQKELPQTSMTDMNSIWVMSIIFCLLPYTCKGNRGVGIRKISLHYIYTAFIWVQVTKSIALSFRKYFYFQCVVANNITNQTQSLWTFLRFNRYHLFLLLYQI